MRYLIPFILINLLFIGSSFGYVYEITYQLNMMDGNQLEWKSCKEKGDEYCTEIKGGFMCIPKNDLESVIKVENHEGKITKTTMFRNMMNEKERKKYLKAVASEQEIARQRWKEDEERQAALHAARKLEYLEKNVDRPLNEAESIDKRATEAYGRAWTEDPEVRVLRERQRELRISTETYKEAVRATAIPATKKPEVQPSEEHFNKGVHHYKGGSYDLAIEHFKKNIEIKPSAESYTYLGLSYDKMNHFTSSIDEFTKAIKIDPSYKSAYLYRGRVYQKRREYDKAIEDYYKAIEIDPKYAEAYSNLADCYHKMEHYDKSKEYYQKSCDLGNKEACAVYKSISK